MHVWSKINRLVVTGAVFVVLSGRASAPPAATTASSPPASSLSGYGTVVAHGLDALPSATLTDWVSYADTVVVVRVIAESRGVLTAEEAEAGERLELRFVDLDISDTLWSGPRGLTPSGEITVSPNAWVVSAHAEDRLLVFPHAARMEVGHEYLVPLIHDAAFDSPWQALSVGSVLPFDDSVVGQGEAMRDEAGAEAPLEDLSEAAQQLWGLNSEGVARALASTSPDSAAKAVSSLPPTERYRAVQKATADTE